MRFSPATRGAIVAGLRAGLSLKEACQRADLAEQTVKTWLTRGRKESDTVYAQFAADVDEAREAAKAAQMDEPEFRAHLNKAVRSGSVQAMKLWWEVYRAGDDEPEDTGEESSDPLAEVDELADKRRSRVA